jgi:hypothetical protein
MSKSTKKQAAGETAIEPSADKKQPSAADNYGWEPVQVAPKAKGRPRKAAEAPSAPSPEKKPTREKKPVPALAPERKPTAKAVAPEPSEPEIVVFAFRLAASEREEIHNAVAPSKASRFVRAVALAAARHDMGAIKTAIVENQRTAAT